jgi:hypothetical protein
MKTPPPPDVPGDTEAERFDNAVRMALAVPKEAFAKVEKKAKARKKRARERATLSR